MIQENTEAFSWLRSQLLDIGHQSPDGINYIKTTPTEKLWLKYAEIVSQSQLAPGLSSFMFRLQGDYFFLVVGAGSDSTTTDTSVLLESSVNAGLLTLLLSKRFVKLRAGQDGAEVNNYIMFQNQDPNYSGHDASDFFPFLTPMSLYQLPTNSVLLGADLSQVTCYHLTCSQQLRTIPFSDTVLNAYEQIALEGSRKISFDLMNESLISTSFKHSFLELYRLIERLYPVYYIQEFHISSNSSMPFLDFAATLEDVTGWRPREEDALEKVINNCSPSVNTHFAEAISEQTKASKFLYKLRNSIVHFRANHSTASFTGDQWNILLLGLLKIIDDQYSQIEPLL